MKGEKAKHIDAFKYWCETNEENGVITLPKFLCEHVVEILDDTNARPRGEWTEELAIDFLHNTGWMQRHDEEMTRPHGEWVPCSERLPEEDEDVLAWIERDCWKDGSDYPVRTQEAAIGWHIEGRWHFDGYAGSTTECLAWMPLPEPYKKGGDKE